MQALLSMGIQAHGNLSMGSSVPLFYTELHISRLFSESGTWENSKKQIRGKILKLNFTQVINFNWHQYNCITHLKTTALRPCPSNWWAPSPFAKATYKPSPGPLCTQTLIIPLKPTQTSFHGKKNQSDRTLTQISLSLSSTAGARTLHEPDLQQSKVLSCLRGNKTASQHLLLPGAIVWYLLELFILVPSDCQIPPFLSIPHSQY